MPTMIEVMEENKQLRDTVFTFRDATEILKQRLDAAAKRIEEQDRLLSRAYQDFTTLNNQSLNWFIALDRIAASKRPDGTYNLCREACEQIAKEALCPKP